MQIILPVWYIFHICENVWQSAWDEDSAWEMLVLSLEERLQTEPPIGIRQEQNS